jgi:hypothetical protein
MAKEMYFDRRLSFRSGVILQTTLCLVLSCCDYSLETGVIWLVMTNPLQIGQPC